MRTKTIGIAVLTLCLAFGLTARGGAGAVYVATNATPAAPHDTWATAFTNVQDALDWAESSGGTTNKIRLAGHTFWLTNQIEWTTEGLTISGGYEADPEGDSPGNHDPALWPTVLDASGGSRVLQIDNADNSTLEHVTITGGDTSASDSGAGIRVANSQNVVLSGCIIEDNLADPSASSIRHVGAIRAVSSSLTLTNCIVRNNISENTRGNSTSAHAYGGGIHSDGNLTIVDSQIINNRLRVARTDEGKLCRVRGGGIYFDGTSLDMRNVLVAGNSLEWGRLRDGGGVYVGGGTVTLRHCTLTRNGGAGVQRDGGTVTLTDCIVWGNWTNIVGSVNATYSNIGDDDYDTYGANNINADPLFENAGAGDYRLQHGSPAIDTGLNQAWMADATDLGGLPRILKGIVDMGCYESIPATGTLFFMR